MTINAALEIWKAVTLPAIVTSEWTPATARAGLTEVRRLRHQLDAAQARLIGVQAAETGRDTKAALRRGLGMSASEATKAAMVASVVGKLHGAGEALESGAVSAEHLRLLHPVAGEEGADALLRAASSESPDEFAKRVERWRIERDGPTWRERQRAARGVWFFNAEHGGLGMRAVVGRVEGERIRSILNDLTDRAWKAAHPERAATAGGHGGEPRERRLADALVEVFDGAVVDGSVVDGSGVDGGRMDERGARDGDGRDGDGGVDGDGCAGSAASPEPPDGAESAATPASCAAGPAAPRGSTLPALPTLPTLPNRALQGGAARTAVIVTVDAATMDAELLGVGPISNDELLDVLAGPRTDLYAAVRDLRGAILKFGRSRRLASPLQRLALAVRDRGCVWDGCTARWDRCDVDHEPPWELGGQTDLDELRLLCSNEHHRHRHEVDGSSSRWGPQQTGSTRSHSRRGARRSVATSRDTGDADASHHEEVAVGPRAAAPP